MNPESTVTTAFVQAARAVAACQLGYRPESVHADRGTAIRPDFGFAIEPTPADHLVITLAGYLAHVRLMQTGDNRTLEQSSFEAMQSGLHRLSTEPGGDSFELGGDDVAALMERCWPIVDHVAYTLREVGEYPGALLDDALAFVA
jgi:hypothetical protein